MMDIRTATGSDAPRLAQLSGVLGYPVSSDAMGQRLQRVLARAELSRLLPAMSRNGKLQDDSA